MAKLQRIVVDVTVDASGDAVVYSEVISGDIAAIIYEKDDFADTADFTIETEKTAQSIWSELNVTASKTVYPLALADGVDGAALTAIYVPVSAYFERVKITIAQGGNATTGKFTILTR